MRYSSPQSPGSWVAAARAVPRSARSCRIECEREQLEIVGAVLALAETRADDDRRHRRLLEHPARRDVGRSTRRAAVRCRPAREGSPAAPPSRRWRRRSACTSSCSSRRSRRPPAPAGQASARTGGRRPACHRPAAGCHSRRQKRYISPAGAAVEHREARPGSSRSECRASTSTRRWSVSKLVTPIWRDHALVPAVAPAPASRRDRPGCSKVHQWNCIRSMRFDAKPLQAALDAGAHDVAPSSGRASGTTW